MIVGTDLVLSPDNHFDAVARAFNADGTSDDYVEFDLRSGTINQVHYDQTSGITWLATESRGLKFDDGVGGHLQTFADDSRLGTNNVLSVFVDDDGQVFAGTEGHGLTSLFPDAVPGMVTTPWDTSLSDESIIAIESAGDGELWVLTEHGNLVRVGYDRNRFLSETEDFGIPCRLGIPTGLVVAVNGERWVAGIRNPGDIGTFGGVCPIRRNDTPTQLQNREAIPNLDGGVVPDDPFRPLGPDATGISIDGDGRVWASFRGTFTSHSAGGTFRLILGMESTDPISVFADERKFANRS